MNQLAAQVVNPLIQFDYRKERAHPMPLNRDKSTRWWLVCECGNEPDRDGFESCRQDGVVVEPTERDWDGIHYLCPVCLSIYDQYTLEQAGTASPAAQMDSKPPKSKD